MYVIVKSAVLIPGDDQHAVVPNWRIANPFVHIFYKPLSADDVVQRMLGSAALVVTENISVAWLDELVVIGIRMLGALDSILEVPERSRLREKMNALERQ